MRLLIIDDHHLFASGLRLLLMERRGDLSAVDCVVNGEQALERLSGGDYALVLLDWKLGAGLSGAALIRRCLQIRPQAQVVVVSGYGTPRVIEEAVEAGASGFVSKDSSPEEMMEALSLVMAGGVHLPAVALVVGAPDSVLPEGELPSGRRLGSGAKTRDISVAFPGLTTRHVQVLSRVVSGMSNKEIARLLTISEGTVKQHVNAIFRQIGVSNRTEAVYLLAREGVRFR